MKIVVTPKGLALIAAVDSGLVKETDTLGGYEIEELNKFWDLFSKDMLDKFGYDLNDSIGMLNGKRNKRADYCAKQTHGYLKFALCAILGSLLTLILERLVM